MAFVKNYFGRVSSVSVELPGPPLPEVPNSTLLYVANETRLRWTMPKTVLKNLKYGVFYGVTLNELIESKSHTQCDVYNTFCSVEIYDLFYLFQNHDLPLKILMQC